MFRIYNYYRSIFEYFIIVIRFFEKEMRILLLLLLLLLLLNYPIINSLLVERCTIL